MIELQLVIKIKDFSVRNKIFLYFCSAIGSRVSDFCQMEMKRESGESPELFP